MRPTPLLWATLVFTALAVSSPSAETGAGASRSPDAPSLPDAVLLDQDGHEVRFYSDLVRGRTVVLNFVFTRCRTICPPMGAIFASLQDELGDALGREVALVSISVDPTTDTPARLDEWSERFERREGWTLLTGPKPRVDALLKALGAFAPDPEDHAPLLVVGDEASGAWRRAHGLSSPARILELVDEVRAGAPARIDR